MAQIRFKGRLSRHQVAAIRFMVDKGQDGFTVKDVAQAIDSTEGTVRGYMPALLEEGIVSMSEVTFWGDYYFYQIKPRWDSTPLGQHLAKYLGRVKEPEPVPVHYQHVPFKPSQGSGMGKEAGDKLIQRLLDSGFKG